MSRVRRVMGLWIPISREARFDCCEFWLLLYLTFQILSWIVIITLTFILWWWLIIHYAHGCRLFGLLSFWAALGTNSTPNTAKLNNQKEDNNEATAANNTYNHDGALLMLRFNRSEALLILRIACRSGPRAIISVSIVGANWVITVAETWTSTAAVTTSAGWAGTSAAASTTTTLQPTSLIEWVGRVLVTAWGKRHLHEANGQ